MRTVHICIVQAKLEVKLPAVVLIKIFKSFEYVVFLLQSIQVHSG
jgi:hypothetical protein